MTAQLLHFLITAGNSFITGSAACRVGVSDHVFISQITMLTKTQWETCCWCDVSLWRTAPLPSAAFFSQCELLLLVNVSLKMLQVSCKSCQSTVWQLCLRCLHPSLNGSRREPSQPPLSHTSKDVGCESGSVGSDLGLYQYQPQLLCVHPLVSFSILYFGLPIPHDSTQVFLFPVLAFLTSLAAFVTSNISGSWLNTHSYMILLEKFSLV